MMFGKKREQELPTSDEMLQEVIATIQHAAAQNKIAAEDTAEALENVDMMVSRSSIWRTAKILRRLRGSHRSSWHRIKIGLPVLKRSRTFHRIHHSGMRAAGNWIFCESLSGRDAVDAMCSIHRRKIKMKMFMKLRMEIGSIDCQSRKARTGLSP